MNKIYKIVIQKLHVASLNWIQVDRFKTPIAESSLAMSVESYDSLLKENQNKPPAVITRNIFFLLIFIKMSAIGKIYAFTYLEGLVLLNF